MDVTLRGYTLSLVDDPLPRHCMEFEKASRQFKNQNIKPILNDAVTELRAVDLTSDTTVLVRALVTASKSLKMALDLINDNETLTATADDVVIVKSALQSGWITCDALSDPVEDTSPAWLVSWIAREVMKQYVSAVTIPKN